MCLCEDGVECLNGWQTMWDNDVLWKCVWVWISNEGNREKELVFMYVCVGVFQKGGKYLQKSPDVCLCVYVWTGAQWQLSQACVCVCVYILQALCMAAAIELEYVLPHCSNAVCDYAAAFNTCSSHIESTPLSLEDDGGVGSAASWLITILPVN